jgi:2-phospho-L-lactate/phosphoenolpyruvate guanylyltransferase
LVDVRPAAILPVKRFDSAKQRLGEALGSGSRAALAAAMFADVLSALERSEMLHAIVVVSGEPEVADIVAGRDVILIDDTTEKGQSNAARAGLARATALGLDRAALVPSDCPLLDPAELEELFVRAAGGADVVIVPDRHGTGTNGLLLTPPDAIAPSFGPGSCERHRALARAAGVALRVERPPSLLLDIDTGADLAALRARAIEDRAQGRRGQWSGADARGAHAGGADARALNTRAVLSRSERMDVPSITNAG